MQDADAAVAASGRARTTRSAVGGQAVQLGAHDGPQPAGHPVADHRVADGLADHETGPRTGRRRGTGRGAAADCSGRSGR